MHQIKFAKIERFYAFGENGSLKLNRLKRPLKTNNPGRAPIGAACTGHSMHGDTFLGIIKFDDLWVYHKV